MFSDSYLNVYDTAGKSLLQLCRGLSDHLTRINIKAQQIMIWINYAIRDGGKNGKNKQATIPTRTNCKRFFLKDDLFIVYRLHRCSRKMCFWTPLSKFNHHYPQTVHQL